MNLIDISIPLALEDYLTVIFSAFGLVLLTRMIFQMNRTLGLMALVGTVLTVIGGAMKASWKLVIASGGPDFPVLNYGLFPLIAPGFILVCWSLYNVRRTFRNQPPLSRPWLAPLVTIGIVTLGSIALSIVGGPWRLPFILLGTVGNVGMLVLLTMAAFGRKMKLTGALFIVTLVVVVVMSQMTAIKNPSIGFVWFEQVTQTIAQVIFTLAAWQYSEQVVTTYIRPMVARPA